MLGATLERLPRFSYRKGRRFFRPAEAFDGTDSALWPRAADQGAQVHESGIIGGGFTSRDERGGFGPKRVAAGAGIDRNAQIEKTSEQARDVGFDNWERLVEGECGHGVRGVAADSRKLPDHIRGPGKVAAMFFHDDLRRCPKIASPSVIAQSLPGVENFPFGGRGERGEIREAPHPLSIIRDNCGDLGLLEHELGDEDGVGIAGVAPGEIASMLTIPGEERAPE